MNLKLIAKAAVFRLRHRPLFDDRRQLDLLMAHSGVFDGRRIAVVGNAQSIFDSDDGDQIDGHDVVVRLNRGRVIDPRHQGSRTDVLALATGLAPSEIRAMFGHPLVIWVTPKRQLMNPLFARSATCMPVSEWRRLHTTLDRRRPSAGLITIHMIRELFTPRQISLFGFDWKASKTFYHEQNNVQSWHDWEAERRLVETWIANGPRLTVPGLKSE